MTITKKKHKYSAFILFICIGIMVLVAIPIFATDNESEKQTEIQKNDENNLNEIMSHKPEKSQDFYDTQDNIYIWDGSNDTSWFTQDKSIYSITTAEQLAGLSSLIDSGQTFENITIQLMNDIYINSDDNPMQRTGIVIGDHSYFSGTLDGNGHTIHNININDTSRDWVGFIRMSNGTKPLCNITVTGLITGKQYVGLISYAKNDQGVIIDNCHNQVKITAENTTGGIISRSSSKLTIQNCTNTQSITGSANTGGIIGYNDNLLILENTHNTGLVHGNGFDVGGLAGKNIGSSTISNCTNNADIYGYGSVGGLIGTNAGTIKECENKGGKVESYYQNAGGIVGYQTGYSSNPNEYASLTHCINRSKVNNGTGNNDGYGYGAGGIVASYNKLKEVNGCQNYGDVTALTDYAAGILGNNEGIDVVVENCLNKGNITAKRNYVGGIAATMKGNLKKCQNYGAIKSLGSFYTGGIVGLKIGDLSLNHNQNSGNIEGIYYVGGILGNSKEEISTGDIIGCVNEGYIKGTQFTGGIAGDFRDLGGLEDCINEGTVETIKSQGIDNNFTAGIVGFKKNGKVIDCINEGAIICSDSMYAGGIVGSCHSPISGCINKGDIKAISFIKTGYVGGISGWCNQMVKTCSNQGQFDVTTTDDTLFSIGGIIGYLSEGQISDCQNNGDMIMKRNHYTQIYAGGMVGDSYNADIQTSINTGNIQIITASAYNTGSVIANNNIGGIAGRFNHANINDNHAIEQCVNSGTLSSNSFKLSIGGMTANNTQGKIINCYNTGELISNIPYVRYDDIMLSGIATIYGGIIEDCYNAGKLTADERSMNKVAGIAWLRSVADADNLKNSYFNQEVNPSTFALYTTRNKTGGNDNFNTDTVKGLVTKDMTSHTALNYMKFNNVSLWETKENENNDSQYCTQYYPKLKSLVNYQENPKVETHDFGDGTYRPFSYITTAQQLQDIQNNLKGNYVLKNDIDLEAEDLLSTDSDNNFTAIGKIAGTTVESQFEGYFDGNMKIVSNLKINQPRQPSQGLFGYVASQGVIKNLRVQGNVTGNHYTGGIVGKNDGIVENCYSEVDIVFAAQHGPVGGVVGRNDGIVENCVHKGMIQNAPTLIEISGVVGQVSYGGVIGMNVNTVKNCYHIGDITGTGVNAGNSHAVVGGVVGYNYSGIIENTFAAGKIINKALINNVSTDIEKVGGLVGYTAAGYLKNSYYDLGYDSQIALGDALDKMSSCAALDIFQMDSVSMKKDGRFINFDENWVVSHEDVSGNGYYAYYPQLKVFQNKKENYIFYHIVELPHELGYTSIPLTGYQEDGKVLSGQNYEFEIKLIFPYAKHQIIVKDNDNILTGNDLKYQINNIHENHHITVEIKKDIPVVHFPHDAQLTYGELLTDAKINGTSDQGFFEFVDKGKKLSVKESGQKQRIRFIPSNIFHYEIVESEIPVYVQQAVPKLPSQIHLDYQAHFMLKNIQLPEGWSWKNGEQIVQVGEHKYLAKYYDSQGNYKNMNDIEIIVVMNKKDEMINIDIKPNQSSNSHSYQQQNHQVSTGDVTKVIICLSILLLSATGMIVLCKKRTKHK